MERRGLEKKIKGGMVELGSALFDYSDTFIRECTQGLTVQRQITTKVMIVKVEIKNL